MALALKAVGDDAAGKCGDVGEERDTAVFEGGGNDAGRVAVGVERLYDGRLSPSAEADRFFDFVIPADVWLKRP